MWRSVARIELPMPLKVAAFGALCTGLVSMLTWREVKAKELYLDHCDVAIANPEFSNPELAALDLDAHTVNGSREAFEQYEWYVARLVYTLDECLKLSPVRHWYKTAESQLANHKAYFACAYYRQQRYLPHYSKRMQMLIRRAAHA
jgi:hypothetical protein